MTLGVRSYAGEADIAKALTWRFTATIVTSSSIMNGYADSGRTSSGPVFFTLPTALPTRQILSTSSGHGLSSAINSSSVAGSSPSHFAQSGLKPGDRWCLCAPRWIRRDRFDLELHGPDRGLAAASPREPIM